MMWLLEFAGVCAAGLVLCAAMDARAERTAPPAVTDPCADSRAASSDLRAECRALPAGDPR